MSSKVLLVTGSKAESFVRRYSAQTSVETEIEVLPISVASFMNLDIFLNSLKEKDLQEISMIIVPGLAEFDLEKAEKELEKPVFKGPKHAADIPIVLDNLNKIGLSKDAPASSMLTKEVSSGAEELIREVEDRLDGFLEDTSNYRIGEGNSSVLAGPDFPPRIVAEIVDAPSLSSYELIEIGERYVKNGAEILDIGMTTQGEMSGEIPRIISQLREEFDVPLSIDTTDEDEIDTAVENGIDLVVSIDGSTIESFEELEVPAVIIPRNPAEDYYPTDPDEKNRFLSKLQKRAHQLGYERILADPILEPVGRGFVDSLSAYRELSEISERVPLFMGVGNVIELFDADSIGMSALLIGCASEMNVDLVLSVEASNKTRGNISEIATARDMTLLAEERGSVPKDLGLDLLRYKEKRKLSDPYEEEVEDDARVVSPSDGYEFPRDRKGFFRIFTQDSNIVAVFYSTEGSNVVIKGDSAASVLNEIVGSGLVSELSHAAYLGREIQKAEIAIKTGRGYIQEEDVF